MDRKFTPVWVRILILLAFGLFALLFWAFGVSLAAVYGIIPLFSRWTTADGRPLGIWILLALLAGCFVWMGILFCNKKHRFLTFLCAFYALCIGVQCIPYLDTSVHTETPELAASFQTDRKQNSIEEIYYDSFLYGSSMRTKPQDDMPAEAAAALAELRKDRSRTWIVTYGTELTSVTWSYRNVWHYNTMLPWMIGLQCDWDQTTRPGDSNTVYIYSIPFAPIDNIS